MLNVFDIFKMLIGIVIFVLLISLFLRFSGSYSELSQTGKEYDAINAFDELLQSTYTSGNPGEFQGFGKIDVEFVPPGEQRPFDNARIKFPSGQSVLSVPAFVMTGEGAMNASRTCDDYGWFFFCYVIAMPAGDTVLFSPVAGSDQEKTVIKGIVASLPPGVTVGYCDGDSYVTPSTAEFLALVNSNTKVSAPCSAQIPEGYWLVSFTPGAEAERTAIVNGGMVKDSAGNVDALTVPSDVTVALCGKDALLNKQAMFEHHLATAASVMHERAVIVHGKMRELNVEPCRGCPTPYPRDCGWLDMEGDDHLSNLYLAFTNSLSALESTLEDEGHSHAQVIADLKTTQADYESLEEAGCE